MPQPSTRGFGLLEEYLAFRRAKCANECIPEHVRSGTIVDLACGSPPIFLLRTTFMRKYGIDFRTVDSSFFPANVTCFQQDLSLGRPLPLGSSSADVVTFLASAEHFAADVLRSIFREAHRILVPGGMFVLTTPTPRSKHLLAALSRIGFVSREEIRDHKQLYSSAMLESLLTESGFPGVNMQHKTFEWGMNLCFVAKKL